MRWWMVLVLVWGTACVVPGSEKKPGDVEVRPSPGQGLLVLRLNAEAEARGVLGSAWASEHADVQELLLVGPSEVRAVDVTGSVQAISVDPGIWKVIFLAGIKRSSGSSSAYLVGSALAEGVEVVVGQRTAVSLVVRSVDVGLVVVNQAFWTQSLTIQASGSTRNARVGMQLAGASTTNRPRFKSVELWNGYREMTQITGTPDNWFAEASGTVPTTVASVSVGLVGAALCIQDGADQWVSTAGLTKATWLWPNRADLVDTHPLVPWTERTVPASPPPTGVDVSVTWE